MVSINDPCVGSGVLLLAAAQAIPRWLIDLGYIQFTGCDIRRLPVRMTELNLKLYGITPVKIKPADLMMYFELMRCPEPIKDVYLQSRGGITAAPRAPEEAERILTG